MSSSPSTSTETQSNIPRRRSRRFWLIAASLLVVFVIGITTFAVIESRAKAEQSRRAADQAQMAISASVVGQRYANQQLAPSVAYAQGTQTQNPLATQPIYQNRMPPGLYHTQPVQPQPVQPQDPAALAAANEINQLRNQLSAASGEQKKELRKALTEAVGKLFDLRHAAQAKQVENLESELAEAKELHTKRGGRKDEIVERRISELLQSADDLAWNRDIAGNSNAIGYGLSNGYLQTGQPNFLYTPQPTPSYPNPYDPGPNLAPAQSFPNSLPPSSTPPQFIPLNSNSGQTTLLKIEPSAKRDPNATSPLPDQPLFRGIAPSDDAPQTTIPRADVPSASGAIETDRFNSSGTHSKALIEAAYNYEESLEMTLETKKLVEQRVVSKQEFAASKRKVAKSKALWANICREIESQRNLLEEEVAGIEMTMREINATRSTQSEIGMRLLKLQAESRSVHESYAWGREFQKQTIDPLEQRLAQSEGDTTAEKKSETPREPVASE